MIDLEARQVAQDPYPAYQALRQMGDVYYDAQKKTCYVGGYQASADLLKDNQTFSAKNQGVERSLSGGDGPIHARVRRFLLPAFNPSQVAALEAKISSLADLMAERLAAKKRCDIVDAYSVKIPLTVTAWMLGIDEKRLPDLHRWSQAIMYGRHGRSSSILRRAINRFTSAKRRAAGNSQVNACHAFLKSHFQRASKEPTGGWVTDSIAQGCKQGHLSEDELLDIGVLMLVAGPETTTNLMGNAILILARDRTLQERLRGEPQLLKPFIEEVLRFESPIQRRVRLTTVPTQIAGISLPEGTSVQTLIGSANRDPQMFSEPDQFRFDRPQNRHLSFGLGPHYCMGAQLARVETFLSLQSFMRRLPPFSLTNASEPLHYIQNNKLRGPIRLSISFG